MGQTWVVRWTCLLVLMHVHFLTKVWDKKRGDWDIHMGPYKGEHACKQLYKRGGDIWNQVDMHLWIDACTHSNQDVGSEKGLLDHVHWTTWRPTFLHTTMQRSEQMWGVEWTCTNVLMYTHILTKVWDKMRDDWDTQIGPYRDKHFCTQLFKGWSRCGESGRHACYDHTSNTIHTPTSTPNLV